MRAMSRLAAPLAALLLPVVAECRQIAPVAPVASAPVALAAPAAAVAHEEPGAAQLPSTYVLGPDDQVSVVVLNADEISNKGVRIDSEGYIRLGVVGRVRAAGLSATELEAAIAARAKEWINQPDVSVSIVEYHSQPVSVFGSVRNPGVVQLQGRRTLVEVLSLVGGLAADAGPAVKITRRLEWGAIPLPGAANDPTNRFSVAEIDIGSIMEGDNPAGNIAIYPQDVVSIPKARPSQMVYVLGTVPRSGGYILGDRPNLSVLHALALAGGTDKGAAPKNARILRPGPDGKYQEFPVDLTKLLAGRLPDVVLQPEDVLFVPSSRTKKFLTRVGDVLALTASAAVYRIP